MNNQTTELLAVSPAKDALIEQFVDTPEVMARIGQLSERESQVFQALADGYTISNFGYETGADIEITRADGVIGSLRREWGFPIDDIHVPCMSTTGRDVTRVKYIITDISLHSMEVGSKEIFAKYMRMYAIKKNIHENHDVKRLINRYGNAGAMRRVMKQAFKDSDIDSVQMASCNNMVEYLCDCLENGRIGEREEDKQHQVTS
jgi:hypothetical protein